MKIFKRSLTSILILGTIYFCISYSTEERKYEIINQIFIDTDFQPKKICATRGGIDYNKEIFDELSLLDKLSAYFQFTIQYIENNMNLEGKISRNKIKNAEIIDDCSARLKIVKIDEDSERWEIASNSQISLPILSIDQKTALIQIRNNCGMLCGESTLYAFKKINGKWKVSKKTMTKIS